MPTNHHFLILQKESYGVILTPMPNQSLRKEPLDNGIIVKGFDNVKKKYPLGTVFGTTTLKKVFKKGGQYYQVEDLYCLDTDITDVAGDMFAMQTKEQLLSTYLHYKKVNLTLI